MAYRILLVLVALAVFVGALAGTKALQIKSMIAAGEAATAQVETVVSTTAQVTRWENTLQAVATLSAEQGVVLSTEIAGTVQAITFESGSRVEKGALLVQLDTSVERAQLDGARAQLDLAKIQARRLRELVASKSAAQSDLDAAEASVKSYAASLDQILATIAKKTLRAPFTGTVGIRKVNIGQFLQAGDEIVSLQAVDRLYVDFSLPQQQLPLLKQGLKVRVETDTAAPVLASLTAVEPALDSATRTVRVRALFDNSTGALRPGMYAKAHVILPEESQLVAIPSAAVLTAPYGDSVFLIQEKAAQDGTKTLVAVRQIVRLGRTRGDLVEVVQGLKGGETIVAAGAFKLRNDTPLAIDNTIAPGMSETPNVENK